MPQLVSIPVSLLKIYPLFLEKKVKKQFMLFNLFYHFITLWHLTAIIQNFRPE